MSNISGPKGTQTDVGAITNLQLFIVRASALNLAKKNEQD